MMVRYAYNACLLIPSNQQYPPEIIRSRLLVDERPLKRLIKKFYAIASCTAEEMFVMNIALRPQLTFQLTLLLIYSATVITPNSS